MRAFYTGPFAYIFSFTLGAAAFRLRLPALCKFGDVAFVGVIAASAIWIVKPALILALPYLDQLTFISLISFACILFGSSQSYLFRTILTNKLALFLGTVSYGVYLSHWPCMKILSLIGVTSGTTLYFFSVAGLSIAFSTATYILLERPSLALISGLHFGELWRFRFR